MWNPDLQECFIGCPKGQHANYLNICVKGCPKGFIISDFSGNCIYDMRNDEINLMYALVGGVGILIILIIIRLKYYSVLNSSNVKLNLL